MMETITTKGINDVLEYLTHQLDSHTIQGSDWSSGYRYGLSESIGALEALLKRVYASPDVPGAKGGICNG